EPIRTHKTTRNQKQWNSFHGFPFNMETFLTLSILLILFKIHLSCSILLPCPCESFVRSHSARFYFPPPPLPNQFRLTRLLRSPAFLSRCSMSMPRRLSAA